MIDLAQRRRLGRSAVSVSVVAGCRSRVQAEQSVALLAQAIPADFWAEAGAADAGARAAEAVR